MQCKISETMRLYINDTQREKRCFTQLSTMVAAWLLLTFFICLHNQLSSVNLFSYTQLSYVHLLSYIKEYKYMTVKTDSKNE